MYFTDWFFGTIFIFALFMSALGMADIDPVVLLKDLAKFLAETLQLLIELFKKIIPKKRVVPEIAPYVMYDSPDFLHNTWRAMSYARECEICGMDDLPVFMIPELGHVDQKFHCKWCAELNYLKRHLRSNGTRRFTPLVNIITENERRLIRNLPLDDQKYDIVKK